VTIPRRGWLALSVAGLALAASLTSLGNGFAYDDNLAILINPRVHTLAFPWQAFVQSYWPVDRGGGLYRPLTVLLFAVQWAVGQGSPFVFHLVNVLLYAGLSALVFWCALALLPEGAAWLVAALFAVHPVHVEAVGNLVGQAELTTALAVVLAVGLYLRWRQAAPEAPLAGRRVGLLGLLYLAACTTKEHGIVLPGLLLAAEATVLVAGPWRARVRQLRPLYLLLALIALAFLAVRTRVLGSFAGDLSAQSFQSLGAWPRLLTMLALVPQWIRLLYWPAHLQADYSSQETRVIHAPDLAVAFGALLLLLAAGIAVRVRRDQPVVTFGVLWVLIALFPTSNLVIPTGIVLAERTMFLPSIGAMLVLGALGTRLWPRASRGTPFVRTLATAGLGCLLAAAALRSAARQPVWANDEVLKTQMVIDAPRSYWAHWLYGDYLYHTDRLAEGERHMRLAVELEPDNAYIQMLLGQRYQDHGFCEPAVQYLARSVELTPERWRTRLRLIRCQLDLGRLDDARAQIQTGLAVGLSPSDFKAALRSVDSAAAVAGARR
jgi:protein O-mannosyl-transferase